MSKHLPRILSCVLLLPFLTAGLFLARGDIQRGTISISEGSPPVLSTALTTDTNPNVATIQDVVWYVIVGSFPKNQRWQANALASRVKARGYNMDVYDSSDFAALTPGLWVVMDGPYTERQARPVLNNVLSVVKGAYIKVAGMSVIAQEGTSSAKAPLPPRIANIRDTSVVDGCGCYFKLPAEWKKKSDKYIFMEGIEDEGPWMNIDGKDVKLKLVGKSSGSDLKVGSRSEESYKANGITVRVDYVVTRVCRPDDQHCESTDSDATFTVTKAGRKRVIQAKGVCGC